MYKQTLYKILPNHIKSKPKRKLNALIGIFLGFSLGVLIAFINEYFDNTIKNISDV